MYVAVSGEFNSAVVSCDCLAHRFGNAADHPDRQREYDSDMTDAEWVAVRDLLPVPGWLRGKGGQPEGYCHRQIRGNSRHLMAVLPANRAVPPSARAWHRGYCGRFVACNLMTHRVVVLEDRPGCPAVCAAPSADSPTPPPPRADRPPEHDVPAGAAGH